MILIFLSTGTLAVEDKICAVYITGVGCPNCAFTDPVLLSESTTKYPNLIIIEYEIYHQRESNSGVSNQYFDTYIPVGRPGVPFLIFGKENTALGRFGVLGAGETIEELTFNDCPLADGSAISFGDLDLTSLPGKPKIWGNKRILISIDGSGDNELLKNLLTTENISTILEGADFEEIEAQPVQISEAKINFEGAIKIGGWIFQWNGAEITDGISEISEPMWKSWYWLLLLVALLGFLFLIYKFLTKKLCVCFSDKQKNFFIAGMSIIILIGFFIFAKSISPDFLKEAGISLPLPLFTFFIALVDGFNPCNLFVLTLLLGFLVGVSHNRKKIYIIGFSFVVMVFFIYSLFMAAWLNIFKFIGFITPLRVAIAIVAIVAGLINCKELFAFRKGVTLMVQERHKRPLIERIERMKGIIKRGSTITLISSSILLAAFASLVELPCTAGFPIIYAGILTGKVLASSLTYYFYLLFYNVIYVLPLAVVIGIFGWTFKGKQISKRQMQIIKFIGGLIMILLGIILLVNPSLISITI